VATVIRIFAKRTVGRMPIQHSNFLTCFISLLVLVSKGFFQMLKDSSTNNNMTQEFMQCFREGKKLSRKTPTPPPEICYRPQFPEKVILCCWNIRRNSQTY